VILAVGVALVGGIGAVMRYVTDMAVSAKLGRSLPWGTMVINIVGSGLAGFLLGLTTYQAASPTAATILLVGFLGGFTTASTIAYEAVRLIERRQPGRAIWVIFGTMVTAITAGIAGLAIGGQLT
jgi:CrcB protein